MSFGCAWFGLGFGFVCVWVGLVVYGCFCWMLAGDMVVYGGFNWFMFTFGAGWVCV